MSHGNNKAVVVACMANAGIAVAKIIGFLMTGAASMLAEAVHSLADTGNQALLLIGSRRGQRPEDAAHPFGFGRERYFWSFVVAMVLFALGSVYAIYEGVHRLLHPEPLTSPGIAVGILGIAVLLEGWSFRTALKEAEVERGAQSWLAYIRHTKAAELPVVLLEDTGAMIGLFFAFLGVGLSVVTGNAQFDALGSIVIGLLLGVLALVLSFEMQSLLIGEAAAPEVEDKIRGAMGSSPHVIRVIHLRTVHLAPDELLVGVKLEFDAGLSMVALCEHIDAVEVLIRAAVPIAKRIYVEPDVFRSAPSV